VLKLLCRIGIHNAKPTGMFYVTKTKEESEVRHCRWCRRGIVRLKDHVVMLTPGFMRDAGYGGGK